jgi:hypothetical protein
MFTNLGESMTNLKDKALQFLIDKFIEWKGIFDTIWKFVKEKFAPLFEKEGALGKALIFFKDKILAPLKLGFESIEKVITSVKDLIGKLADKIMALDLSKLIPFIGSSPAPLAVGLMSINDALREMNSIRLPQFAQGIGGLGGGFRPVAAGAGASTASTTNNNQSVTVNNSVRSNMDLAAIQATVERTVVRILRNG